MSTLEISRLIGTVSLFLLFAIKFYIAIRWTRFYRTGRIAILWTSMYIFFLFILRLLAAFNWGTIDSRTIIAGYSSLIPLLAVIIHLFLDRKIDQDAEELGQISKLR